MGSSSDSYSISRTNAVKYGVTVERPMTCPGRARCLYRYCDDLSFKASAGCPCAWEVDYAAQLERAYRRTYDHPAMRRYLEDLDEIIEALVVNGLKRNRISFRSNRAWSFARTDPVKASDEMKLCDRYFVACLRELDGVLTRLGEAMRQADEAAEVRRRYSGMVFSTPSTS